jgi:ferritin-like metal-binding protein YciE
MAQKTTNTQNTQQTDKTRDLVVTWLKDAHAMETGIAEALQKQVDATADTPMVQAGIQRHLETTKGHIETVQTCLEGLGESPSGFKAGVSGLGAKVQGMVMGMPEDSLIKFALQDFSAEHMEIASYKALIIAAEAAGLPEVATACQGILRDEEAMAAWLDENLPMVVRESLAQAAA